MTNHEKISKPSGKYPPPRPVTGAPARAGKSIAGRPLDTRAPKATRAADQNAAQGDRLARAAREQDERIRQKELERSRIAAEKEQARQERIRQARQESLRRQQEQHANTLNKAAKNLPDLQAIEIARAKLNHNRKLVFTKSIMRFLIIVVLPTMLVAFYQFFWATPLYQARSSFAIETSQGMKSGAASGIFGMGGFSGSLKDTFMVREFILSPTMMHYLEKDHSFVSRFKNPDLDYLTRFQSIPMLDIGDYWNYLRRVRVSIDVQSGILHLYVQAPTPKDAVIYSSAILKRAEEQVNQLSLRIFDDQVLSMKQETEAAEKNLERLRKEIIQLQIKHGELNPRETVAAAYKVIQEFEAKIKEVELRRKVEERSNVGGNPAITRFESQLAVLRQQLAEQRNRLVGSGKSEWSLNNILASFEYANIRLALAQKRWETLLASLETSRQNALHERRYLSVIMPPEQPQFPSRMEDVKTVIFIFFSLLMVYLTLSVFITAIRLRTR